METQITITFNLLDLSHLQIVGRLRVLFPAVGSLPAVSDHFLSIGWNQIGEVVKARREEARRLIVVQNELHERWRTANESRRAKAKEDHDLRTEENNG